MEFSETCVESGNFGELEGASRARQRHTRIELKWKLVVFNFVVIGLNTLISENAKSGAKEVDDC